MNEQYDEIDDSITVDGWPAPGFIDTLLEIWVDNSDAPVKTSMGNWSNRTL